MYNKADDEELKACVSYFKENKGYHRMLCEMLAKWKKYGKVTGTISIKNVTAEEFLALQRLTGKVYEGEILKFKMAEFQQALKESRFHAVSLEELLAAYFGEVLITTKSEQLAAARQKQKFWQELLDETGGQEQDETETKRWLLMMWKNKTCGYQLVQAMFQEDQESAKAVLLQVCSALRILKRKKTGIRTRLAVLSAQVTGNPHFFDRNRTAGKLLLNALAFIYTCDYPRNAEGILELYDIAGISPDDISSFTTAYGIHMYSEDGVHRAYETFIEKREPYVVTLSNLNRIVMADCPDKRVYIMENQMVFSQLCEDLKGKDIAFLCTSGQVKTASLILIDLLCKSGCRLFYSGDLDPEGITIADRLIARHPQQISAWHMEKEDYVRSVSEERIDEKRLKKLEMVKDPGLMRVAAEVMCVKRAGYQEQLLEVFKEELSSAAALGTTSSRKTVRDMQNMRQSPD